MALFKVVKRISHHEDHVYFVEAPNDEAACKREKSSQAVAILKSQETALAAVRATDEEIADFAAGRRYWG
jgi:hypothetical protein